MVRCGYRGSVAVFDFLCCGSFVFQYLDSFFVLVLHAPRCIRPKHAPLSTTSWHHLRARNFRSCMVVCWFTPRVLYSRKQTGLLSVFFLRNWCCSKFFRARVSVRWRRQPAVRSPSGARGGCASPEDQVAHAGRLRGGQEQPHGSLHGGLLQYHQGTCVKEISFTHKRNFRREISTARGDAAAGL